MYRAARSLPAVSASLPGDGDELIWFTSSLLTVKATAETTGGAFDLVEELIPPGFSPVRHVHHREEECFFVISGRMTFFCGDETIEAGPGAFVILPRDVPHTFRVEGTEPAHTLMLASPAGLVGFFRELGEPAQSRTLPPPRRPDVARFQRVAAAYGCEILPPADR